MLLCGNGHILMIGMCVSLPYWLRVSLEPRLPLTSPHSLAQGFVQGRFPTQQLQRKNTAISPTAALILMALNLHCYFNAAQLDTCSGLTVLTFSMLLSGSKRSASFVATLQKGLVQGHNKNRRFLNLGHLTEFSKRAADQPHISVPRGEGQLRFKKRNSEVHYITHS